MHSKSVFRVNNSIYKREIKDPESVSYIQLLNWERRNLIRSIWRIEYYICVSFLDLVVFLFENAFWLTEQSSK